LLFRLRIKQFITLLMSASLPSWELV